MCDQVAIAVSTEYKMESPYLEAIQKIPGKTPSEKYQALNCIARKLIDNAMETDDNCVKNVDVKSSAELPECLVPIVRLEVAKILHQPDGIRAALKSDDAFINDRALKVKWFFDGSNEDFTNSQYFNKHIFPHVSLTVRMKIIKNLAKYLMLSNKQSIAENFYIELKEQYGEELVRPLCFACGEDFIRITTNKWIKPVTVSELEIIHPRFPKFVISSVKSDPVKYSKFLPKLLKRHADNFVDIVKQYNLNIKLSSKKCQLFLKNARNAFLDDPKYFMPVLPLKLITTMLNKLEFHQFYKKMFPQNQKEFCFITLYKYLKYYPEEEKLNLLISIFEELYGISFLECVGLISFPQLLVHNYADVFVNIVKRFNLNNKLSNKNCESFFNYQLNRILNTPLKFLKLITEKLNKLEFYHFFKHLFPQNYEGFCFTTYYQLLEYYPKEEKLNLLISTFEDLYGVSPLECALLISFPLLLEDHADVFVDIVKMFNLDNNQSNKKCESFLKNVLDPFSRQDKICMPLQSLELITTMLNKLEFYQFYKHLFPLSHEELHLATIYGYLEYYPKEEKFNLLMSTFEDVYGLNFLEWIDSMSLQRLLKNHADYIFVNVVKEHTSNIKLSDEKSESLPLESITEKLNKLEFHQFYKLCFPQNYKDFSFTTIYKQLKYYPEKINLLISTFEDVYGISLLECDYLITPDLLRLLDHDQRIKIARKKIETNDTPTTDIKCSWICYLPTNESIPLIKEKISKESVASKRCEYLQELIYTCSVNKDCDALLNVLEYIFIRHKSEQNPVIPNVLNRLRTDFDVKNLPKEHLVIVEQLVMFLHVKNELKSCVDVSLNLVRDLIFSKLKHNEKFDKYIELYVELNSINSRRDYDWNIFKDCPDYERKWLTQICMYDYGHDLPRFVDSLLRSIYDFNERNAKADVPLEKLSTKNYPLLYKADWRRADELLEIRSGWVNYKPKLPEKIEFDNSNVIKLLRKSPEKIIKKWRQYHKICKDKITRCNLARRFLREARWHQDLPIMFANQCLEELEIKENVDIHKNLCILAVLYEGASYEKLLTPFIPESKTLDLTTSITKDEYKLNCSILWSLNIVNPPVSFSPIFEFCQGDYVHDAVNTLNNVGRRVPVGKVIEFSKTLVNQKVSVKKHGIRLFCQVASHNQIQEMMSYLWKKEKNLSIREILYQYIFKLFVDAPSSQSWSIIQSCMNEVNTEDHFWNRIFDVSEVPDDFYECYISKLLETIKRIEETEKDFGPSKSHEYITHILNDSSHRSYLFSEEFHQYIIKNYFADFSRPEYLLSDSCQNYIIKEYIVKSGDKLESRLVFLTDLISEIVKTSWNVPSAFKTNLFPANYLIYKLISCICDMKCDHVKIRTAKVLLDALLTVLKPGQLGTSYLDLVYIGILDNEYTVDQMTHHLVQLIPSLVEMYSSELISTIVQHFQKLLNIFLDTKKNTHLIDIIEKLVISDEKNVLLFTSTLLLQSIISNDRGRHSIMIDELKINSEKLHQFIIQHYFANFSKSQISLSDHFRNYIINEYITKADDQLESRLVFLSDVISEIVKTSWNILSTYNTNLLSANFLIFKLISCICDMKCDYVKIRTAKVLLDALLTVLKPEQLGTSYLDLVYIGILNDEFTIDQMTSHLVQLIPSLVKVYSSESMSTILQHFRKHLHMFLKNKENTGAIDVIDKLIRNNDKDVNHFTSKLLSESIDLNRNDQYPIIIDTLDINSEELHQFIIRLYFLKFLKADYFLPDSIWNYTMKIYIAKAGNNLESRLVFLSNVISEMVEKTWNVPCIYNTVNYLIFQLIECICNMSCDHIKIRTAEVVVDALLKVLKPEQLGTSYLELVYAGVFDNEYTIDQVTHKLVQLIPSLVYSSESMSTIVKNFKKPLHIFLENKNHISVIDIIEKLILSDDENVLLFTSTLLSESTVPNKEEQYPIIINEFEVKSEELHQFIIRHYFTNFLRPEYFSSGRIWNYTMKIYLSKAGNNLESRLVFLSDVIAEVVKKSWNVPFVYQTNVLTVNYLIFKLIEWICNMSCDHIKIRTAEVVVDALLKVLKPEQLGTSYLELVYAGVFDNEYTIDQVTHKLVQLIPSLVRTYSSELMSTIVQHFRKPLHIFLENKNHISVIDIMEKLILSDDENVLLFTSTLLSESTVPNKEEQYPIIIDILEINSEELHQFIIRHYFTNFLRPEYFSSDRIWNYIIKKYIARAGDNLESRLVFIADLFLEVSKTSWNVPSAYKTDLLPANYVIYKMISRICDMECDHIKLRTAKVLLDALLTILKPEQLGTSYLDLVYIGILDNEYTVDQMTHQLVQLIPSLIEIYSTESMTKIVQRFKKPLDIFLDNKGNTHVIDVIEKLVLCDDKNVLLFTRTLLLQSTFYNEGERYSIIINKLIMNKHPAIAIPIIDKLNSRSPNININDLPKR